MDEHTLVHDLSCELFGYIENFLTGNAPQEQILEEIRRTMYQAYNRQIYAEESDGKG